MEPFLTRARWLASAEDPGQPDPDVTDVHVAFRGRFALDEPTTVTVLTLGASWYEARLDGEFLVEGPLRYPRDHPEFDASTRALTAGEHVIAVHAHSLGVDTRMLTAIEPFVCFAVTAEPDIEIPVAWKACRLTGFARTGRRLNPQLAWIEWRDSRRDPDGWEQPGFDDADWPPAVPVVPSLGDPAAATISSVPLVEVEASVIARGPLAEAFGYELDDPPARFFLRDLECADLPADGFWMRYDLGRIRLVRPELDVTLPAGAVMEIGYAEQLRHGRVSPHITLSTGPSANLDHVIARGGRQRIRPLHPKGARFVEVHVLGAHPDETIVHGVRFRERCSVPQVTGSFTCGDPLLERIWRTGVDTFRSCAEDALVDNPTRERGQWTGDLVSVGLDVGAVISPDVRLIRRGLRHAAQCARDDGLVAALCPGGVAYLPSFAAQWVPACLRHWELTGDQDLLAELYPSARANLAAFTRHLDDEGVHAAVGANFVDWGYAGGDGPTDVALNLQVLGAVRGMTRWAQALGDTAGHGSYADLDRLLTRTVRAWLDDHVTVGGWDAVGYHAGALALGLDLVPDDQEHACREALHDHLLRCFPNDPSAPRNADPSLSEPRLITPYFAHFAFPPLIERGDMDFVLDQYRTCWGWALGTDGREGGQGGRTTWVEVFDTRWSHCHAWSGAPTWQLSRYVLGLHPRFDRGPLSFDLRLHPGSLAAARGTLPVPGHAEPIRVAWDRAESVDELVLHVDFPEPLQIVPVGSDGRVRIVQAH